MKERYIEKECKKHGTVRHILENRGSYRCVKCRVISVQKRRDLLKLKAVEYKGGRCERCGYNKCVAALDFHHKDPKEKDFGISQGGKTRSWDKMKIELDKCIMVCSNCHREIHTEIKQIILR